MAWDLLFLSDYGLFSLFVILFVVGIAFGFSSFFSKKIREDEARAGK